MKLGTPGTPRGARAEASAGARRSGPPAPPASIPAIVLGSGLTALGTIRSLAREGIPSRLACRPGDLSSRSRHAHLLDAPPPESDDAEALARWLEALPFERAVLFACSDLWLAAVSRLPDSLRARFPWSGVPWATLRILVDKGLFAEALRRFGVPHPRTIELATAADLDGVADADLPRYFLKPRDSQRFGARYGAKAFLVRDRAEARARLDAMAAGGLGAVLQEYVPGGADRHVFLDGFRDRTGRVRALFARRRVRMYPGDFGNSTMLESIPLEEVAPAWEGLSRLLAGLSYRGIFSAEFKQDPRDGAFRLLEVNARPWWFVEFATISGANVCSLAMRDALDLPVEDAGPYHPGGRFVHLRLDFAAYRGLRREGRLGFGAWIRSIWGSKGALLRWSDPAPALADGFRAILSACRRG